MVNLYLDGLVYKIYNSTLFVQEGQNIYSKIGIEEFFLESLKFEDVVNYYKTLGVNYNLFKNNLENFLNENIDYIKYSEELKGESKVNLGIKTSYEIEEIFNLAAKDAFYKNESEELTNLTEYQTKELESDEINVFASYKGILTNILQQKDDKYNIKNILVNSGITLELLSKAPEIKTNGNNMIVRDIYSINRFLRDLNEYDDEEHQVNFVEREKEINLIIDSLCLYNKKHVILTGGKGIGKKAIVQELAKRIQTLNNDHFLYKNKIIQFYFGEYILNMKTKSFPFGIEKMEDFNDLLNSLNTNIILFIDGSHKCLEYNVSDYTCSLEPIMNNPKVQIIYMVNDDSNDTPPLYLASNSTIINIKELNDDQVEQVIAKNIERYKIYHNIKLSKKLIKPIIELTNKYFTKEKQPKISFDIIDRVCAKCSLLNKREVSKSDVENIIFDILNISTNKQINSNKDDLKIKNILNLEQLLSKNIIGQEEAITKLSDIIMIAQSGIANNGNNKPMASFMFAGSTGVGKTELAKNLSKALNMNFLRLDMSEYSERHFSSSLIGSPPGYHGHEEGGILTNFIKENPSTVLLLDEIEKSHKSIYNIFLQVLDYGCLKNNKGEPIDFTKCIIIFTTNASETERKRVGFADEVDISGKNSGKLTEINRFFSPEFRNRLDDIILFKQLDKNNLSQILDLKLNNLGKTLKNQNIIVEFDNSIKTAILNESVKEQLGARPLERNMNRMLNKDLARLILLNQLERKKHGTYNVSYDNKLNIINKYDHHKKAMCND